jgi:hypothetical protein
MVQNQANLCVKCEMKFYQWLVYHAHVTTNKCYKKILPKKTSNRAHDQIVADVEKTWGSALIG